MSLISEIPTLVGHDQFSVPCPSSTVGENCPLPVLWRVTRDRALCSAGHSARDQSLFEGTIAEMLLFDPFPFSRVSVFTQIFFT